MVGGGYGGDAGGRSRTWRRWKHPHVDEHGQDVGPLPVFDDEPVGESNLVNSVDSHRASGGCHTEERPRVGSRPVQSERGEVAVPDEFREINVRVGKGAMHVVQHDSDEAIGSVHITECAVRHQVSVDDATNPRFVVVVDGGNQPLDY